ncbi:hypothetical protein FUA23_00260 [Neolewinella aurantiaca]|uniref:Uncharacterized protein n=1 Tax=Neolewinella aurantiaca TaxID=2602767 RepID=A0A5C7FLR7_9BACT|nr:hypothetical protein [Neolewinella aurantiaca]TXF91650.1 hypothetical protein FUA23_00260 [Neolewinella aurantiaca]
MNRQLLSFLLFIAILSTSVTLDAQRRNRKNSEPEWPPQRAYGRTTLGNALQDIFQRHYDFCGFTKAEGKRDYTPPTIERFLGKRTLRTRVEKADINGGNLLSYIFTEDETGYPLEMIRYRADQLLYNEADGVNLLPEPRPGFDAFLLTKNCSGFLKAALDGGLKPPYSSFGTALDTDSRRNSTVVAMAGSFVSPLNEILNANDARTTELMARLWRFYQDHPEYAGKAYFLTQFEGVSLKHLTDAAEVAKSEQTLGVNVAIPLAGSINTSVNRSRTSDNTFGGTDWETIVYTDFAGPYQRDRLFARLPSPQDIENYFRNTPVVSANGQPMPLREGGSHQHSVNIDGLPAGLAGAGWRIDNLRGGAYRGAPSLQVTSHGDAGLSFSVDGNTSPDLFPQDQPGAIANVPLYYELVLPARGNLPALRIPVSRRLPTSMHPLTDMAGTRFELQRKNNGQYAFRWYLTLNVNDTENPLDPTGKFEAIEITAGYPDDPVDLRTVETTFDRFRSTMTVILETNSTWPLDVIDDRNMRTLPLKLQTCMPVKDGYSVCRRPISTRLAVPRIRTYVPVKID